MRLLEPRGEVRLRIALAGDFGAVGRARRRGESAGADALLAPAAGAFGEADVAFLNLEFPVGDDRGGALQRHARDIPGAVRRAGVGVVSLANNHILDDGADGLARTLEACRAAGLETVGAGPDEAAARNAVILERRSLRIAFAAYAEAGATAPGACVAALTADVIETDLAALRTRCDVMVVSVHWGSMYVDYPPPRVAAMAERIAALGADVVVGHHPHVTQGFETRGRSLVLYSLGDLVLDPGSGDFEAEVARETRRLTAVFNVEIAEGHGLSVTPLHLDADGVAAPAAPKEADALVARLRRLSAGLADASANFARESAPQLLRYELQSLGTYLRQGRFDRVLRLLGSVRPRHLPVLWRAIVHGRKSA